MVHSTIFFLLSACTIPLGLGRRMVLDSSITASSYAGKNSEPYRARLNDESLGWCTSELKYGQYLQIDLGNVCFYNFLAFQTSDDISDIQCMV